MAEESVNWDELRVAYDVAGSGSLSRSAEQLGMNHSTILRRINRLEKSLGTRLFIRHQRGYRMTEAGRLLLQRMTPLNEDMQRLVAALSVMESVPSATLKLSTVSDFSGFFSPLLREFRKEYPHTRLQIVATDEVLSLAQGNVHVSIRMGEEPTEPDLIARYLLSFPQRFYASADYVAEHGVPESMAGINQHSWVLPTGRKQHISGIQEVVEQVDPARIVYQSNSFPDIFAAVRAGMGIGPVGIGGLEWRDVNSVSIEGLQQVELGILSEPTKMWFVYHKDMRGSSRIRALLDFILQRIPANPPE